MVCPLCSQYEPHPNFVNRSFCCPLCCICRCFYVRFLLPATRLILPRPNPPEFSRRRGFSDRTMAAMFVATAINFLLSSLHAGGRVAAFIVLVRKGLITILGINYPPSDKSELINDALRIVNIIALWAANFPVSIRLSLPDSVSIHAWWRYISAISLSFGGLGPSSQIDSG